MKAADRVRAIARRYELAAKIFMFVVPVIVLINFMTASASGDPLPWNVLLWGVGFEFVGLAFLLLGRVWFPFVIRWSGGDHRPDR
jgi:hypothetical protein